MTRPELCVACSLDSACVRYDDSCIERRALWDAGHAAAQAELRDRVQELEDYAATLAKSHESERDRREQLQATMNTSVKELGKALDAYLSAVGRKHPPVDASKLERYRTRIKAVRDALKPYA
jgi:hypothetical protein